MDKHIVKLPVASSLTFTQNYNAVPYENGAWKTRNTNRMLHTMHGSGEFSGGGSLPSMDRPLATANVSSPRQAVYDRSSLASQHIRREALNERSVIKLSQSLEAQRTKKRRIEMVQLPMMEEDSIY